MAPNNGSVVLSSGLGSGILLSGLDDDTEGIVDGELSVGGGVAPYNGLSCGFVSSPILLSVP